MEDGTLFGDVVLENVQNVLSCFPVVDDDGKMGTAGNLQMLEEHVHLDISELEVLSVIKTCLTHCDYSVQLEKLLDLSVPAYELVATFRRRDTHCVVDVLGTLEVVVDYLKISEAVAD